MDIELITAIRDEQPEIMTNLFAEGFRKAKSWVDYLTRHFGAGEPTVNRILDKGTSGWSSADFHALYIACWILQPVEKGTFMIRLTDSQRTNVKAGYGTLNARWTSHLHEHGRSAADGWKFLNGYGELLVQMEGGGKHAPGPQSHLFLKAEGHTAFTLAHVKSYRTKRKTGKGEVSNPYLANLAIECPRYGIMSRSAENYSNSWKALLKALGFSGKTTTVQAAAGAMFDRAIGLIHRHMPEKKDQAAQTIQGAGFPAFGVNGEYVAKLPSKDLGPFLQKVVVPLGGILCASNLAAGTVDPAAPSAMGVPAVAAFVNPLRDAVKDGSLKGVVERLGDDAAATGEDYSARYFQEITLDPSILDLGLKGFLQAMSS